MKRREWCMSDKRYEEIKRKSERYGEISTEEYHYILKYDRPEYYENLSNLLENWDRMDQEEVDSSFEKLDPQDQEYVVDHINTWDE